MSQLSESTEFQGTARMRALPGATAFLMIAVIVALGAVMGLDAAGDFVRPAAPAAVQPGSRLDDYGLRHPATTTSAQPGSRLDDYGLRHPAP